MSQYQGLDNVLINPDLSEVVKYAPHVWKKEGDKIGVYPRDQWEARTKALTSIEYNTPFIIEKPVYVDREVIKEVEKLVEIPVEVIREVVKSYDAHVQSLPKEVYIFMVAIVIFSSVSLMINIFK